MEFSSLQSVDDVVQEIMRLHRSLPPRPAIDEVDAAKALIANLQKEEDAKLDAISRFPKPRHVPEELFLVLQEMQKNLVFFQSREQKSEAMKLLDLENLHSLFDDFIQRASDCLNSSSSASSSSAASTSSRIPTSSTVSAASASSSAASAYNQENRPLKAKELFTRDDTFLKKPKSSFYADGFGLNTSSPKPQIQDSSLLQGAPSGNFFFFF